jgi:PEP-CTERM motif
MIRQLGWNLAALSALALTTSFSPWTASCSAATIIGSPVALSTLTVPGGTIVAGDKTFTNFNYFFTGDMPAPTLVNVIPITDNAGNFGIRFQGAFIDTVGAAGGSDALITYNVTAGANHLISDAHIEGNPARLGPLGSISVTETFLPIGGQGQNTMRIYDDQNVNPPKLIDNTVFAVPVKTLSVQKDILGLAKLNPQSPDLPNTVTLSFVDQTFSQITIPEPTSLMLSLVGLIGLVAYRRNR